MKLLLDTNVLAKICHPSDKYRDAQTWFQTLIAKSPPAHEVLVSAITLYELERGLMKSGATESLDHFQRLRAHLRWIPLTADAAQRAVEFWSADGQHAKGISDADLFIAAQAAREGAALITGDSQLIALGKQLGIDVRDWFDFDPSSV